MPPAPPPQHGAAAAEKRKGGKSLLEIARTKKEGSSSSSSGPRPLSATVSSSSTKDTTRSLAAAVGSQATLGVDTMDKLRAELKRRGASGIVGLGRKFRIMDDDGSKSLNSQEFSKGMKECQMGLTEAETKALFKEFDQDGNGSVDYEEFLQRVRGAMNARRLKFVHMAFELMDKDGNGVLEPGDVVSAYDASKHPDVISGKKTKDEIFREFLDNFDVGGEKDGKVTMKEFENYYSNVSASIDDDDYFELMMRNAWHISGGEGWCANTSNRRVLVTHNDGSQSVEEIKNDLGVKATEYEGRLKAQGVRDVEKLSLFGEAGDAQKRPATAPPPGRFASPTYKSSFSLS